MVFHRTPASSSRAGDADPSPAQIEVYRRMTPAQRVAAGCALRDFAYSRLVLHLSRRHPEKTLQEVRALAARRFLGDAARAPR